MSDADSHNPIANSGQATPAVAMFGKMLTFTRIKLQTADIDSIAQHLATILSHKTSQIPVVIDSDIEQDLSALVDLFWSWGLQPIGVVAGVLDDAAKALRLAIFPADGKRIQRIQPAKQAAPPPVDVIGREDNPHAGHAGTDAATTGSHLDAPSRLPSIGALHANATSDGHHAIDPSLVISAEPEMVSASEHGTASDDRITSMIYDQMLRSGQSVNHVGGDLIVTNSVNNGAEAISDNCLHIYGRAQGRLVAGATGDKDARIFCQRFNPSLVSVAGTYCLNDNIPAEFIDKAVQVSFKEGEGLIFQLLNKS